MKIDETENTVTTLDTTFARNPVAEFQAVIATQEKSHGCAGEPAPSTMQAHQDAIGKLLRTLNSGSTPEQFAYLARADDTRLCDPNRIECIINPCESNDSG